MTTEEFMIIAKSSIDKIDSLKNFTDFKKLYSLENSNISVKLLIAYNDIKPDDVLSEISSYFLLLNDSNKYYLIADIEEFFEKYISVDEFFENINSSFNNLLYNDDVYRSSVDPIRDIDGNMRYNIRHTYPITNKKNKKYDHVDILTILDTIVQSINSKSFDYILKNVDIIILESRDKFIRKGSLHFYDVVDNTGDICQYSHCQYSHTTDSIDNECCEYYIYSMNKDMERLICVTEGYEYSNSSNSFSICKYNCYYEKHKNRRMVP